MGDTDALRDKIAQAIAEKFTSPTRSVMRNGKRYDPETFEDYTEPVPMEERINQGAWEVFTDGDGQRSVRSASGYEIADAVLPVVTQEVGALRKSRDHAWGELRNVRDQISEHLLTHVGGDETDPWQAGHNYAMREAARLVREGFDQL